MRDLDSGRRGVAAVTGPAALACVLAVAALGLAGVWAVWGAAGRSSADAEVVEWIDPALAKVGVVERNIVDSDRLLRLYALHGRQADAKAFEVRRAETERGAGELRQIAGRGSREAAQAADEFAAAATRWLEVADEWHRAARMAESSDARTAVLARVGPEDPLASLVRPREQLEAVLADARAERLAESAALAGRRPARAAVGLALALAAAGVAAWLATRARRASVQGGGLDFGLARAILDQLPAAVAVFDDAARPVVSNLAAARALEAGADGRIGLALYDAAGEPVAEAASPLARALAGHHVADDALFARRLDGALAPVEVSAEPIFEDGRVTSAVVVIRGEAERRRLEAEAGAAAARAETAEATAAAVAARLRDVEAELEAAAAARDDLASRAAALEARCGELEAERGALARRGDEASARCEELERLRDEAEARCSELERNALERAALELPPARSNGAWSVEDVLAAVANDLRTPVLSIRGMVEIFRQKYAEAVPDVTALHYLELTQRNADQIAALIDELGDLSDLSASEPAPAELPLAAAVEEAWRASAHAGVELRVAGPLPTVRADRALLLRALRDLFTTAARLRREGPGAWMHIAVRDLGERWEVELTDNGAGFEPEHAEALFGPLAHGVTVARDGGAPTLVAAGLGLAAVRRVAELHGGSASATGTPGEGARYTFSLAK